MDLKGGGGAADMDGIILTSPLSGWAMPLDEVPDPVFAGRMLGDGVAIDPVSDGLFAPCDSVVVSVHASRHAVTLHAAEGAEILLHVGIDTVGLGGRGFTACVEPGQRVRRGDALLRFDLDALLGVARAVVTPMLVTNGDAFAIRHVETGRAVEVGQPLMTLVPVERADAPAPAPVSDDAQEARRTLTVPLAHGIHARPAARIAAAARGFSSVLVLRRDGREADARSPVSMLALGVTHGDPIDLVARGPDAEAAVEALATLIEGGMGEAARAGAAPAPLVAAAPAPAPLLLPGQIGGVPAAPGIAIGRAVWLRIEDRAVPVDADDPTAESAALRAAIAQVRAGLAANEGQGTAAILAAHEALLDDPALLDAAERAIRAGRSAGHGWRMALRAQAEALRATGDARLAERAADLLDIERQVLAALAGERAAGPPALPPGAILLADDLLPSQLVALDGSGIAGFCTVGGGPTSHVAILAAGMGLPALVAAGAALEAVRDGATLILDADQGVLTPDPDLSAQAAAETAVARQADRRALALARAAEEARTADGVRIEAFANLASAEDARLAVAQGAEGCGLLRTEFLFLDRAEAPDEDEQAGTYQAIADALEGRPLIVRLLDVGGDKPAPYLPIAAEENPALGLRGIRVGLARPAILATQLRAILRVAPVGRCRIMVPMIAGLDELRAVRTALDAARAALGIDHPVELGVMIETPAAAITADLIAAEADFLSVGSNDLTQYTLAMDRGNPAVAAGLDGLHPAVLRLIGETCRGGAARGRWTGVCGGLASDPLAVPLLIGLGVTELSATPARLPEIKAAIRAADSAACAALARRALDCATAADVRALARRFGEGEAR